MKPPIANPANDYQRRFNELCTLGGGTAGGPARTKTIDLIRTAGQRLNELAYAQMAKHMGEFPGANPWYVCFSMGLIWGHLAKDDVTFTQAVIGLLTDWNNEDLSTACEHHMERGQAPIRDSLAGAYQLFEKVKLPNNLPDTLEGLGKAQDDWLRPLSKKATRPRYIGLWNGTAMFMTALFAQPKLAGSQREPRPLLPLGAPITQGLRLLYQAHVLSTGPAATKLDDEDFESGPLFEDNALMGKLLAGRGDWSMIDVHSGLYMLGTPLKQSQGWV